MNDTNFIVKTEGILALSCNLASIQYYRDCIEALPDIWNKPTSSTGKYHKREDGTVPTVAEHTYEMVLAGAKVVRLLAEPRSVLSDTILVAIALHDGLKYGEDGMRKHTNNAHDRAMADWIHNDGPEIPESIDMEQLCVAIQFHSGQWSTDAKKLSLPAETFFGTNKPIVLFIHMLDMLSTASVLRHE